MTGAEVRRALRHRQDGWYSYEGRGVSYAAQRDGRRWHLIRGAGKHARTIGTHATLNALCGEIAVHESLADAPDTPATETTTMSSNEPPAGATCSAHVAGQSTGAIFNYGRDCKRRAVVRVAGRDYCAQHSPAAAEQRRTAVEARRRAAHALETASAALDMASRRHAPALADYLARVNEMPADVAAAVAAISTAAAQYRGALGAVQRLDTTK